MPPCVVFPALKPSVLGLETMLLCSFSFWTLSTKSRFNYLWQILDSWASTGLFPSLSAPRCPLLGFMQILTDVRVAKRAIGVCVLSVYKWHHDTECRCLSRCLVRSGRVSVPTLIRCLVLHAFPWGTHIALVHSSTQHT